MKDKIIIFTLLLILLAGCEDVLEKKPYVSVPDFEMFKDVEGAEAALIGVYNSMTSADYYGRHMYAYEGSKGPDFFVEDTGNRFETENAYRETSTSDGYSDVAWDKIYSTIFLCNNILANIELIDGEEDEKRRIKGETLAIRGLAYFDLMRMFAYPPIYSIAGGEKYNDKYKLGVPLILSQKEHVDAAYEGPMRADADVCYDQIVTDLSDAIVNLTGVSPADGRVSIVAANAILARVYMYMGQWGNVITAGENAISGTLLTHDDFVKNYYKPYNSESIWELEYSVADDLGSNALNSLARNPTIDIPGDPNDGQVEDSKVGYAGYGGNSFLRAALRETGTDVREYLICDNRTGNETGVRKYIGDGAHSVHNVPLVRLPEVYLTLAEAYAEQGTNLAMAAEYLNNVYEQRHGVAYVAPATAALLIEDVLKERRKELVFEGHTYWDHFRRAIPFTRENLGSITPESVNIDYSQPQVVYPIPMNEMESNPNIRGQQNPGYAPYVAGQ